MQRRTDVWVIVIVLALAGRAGAVTENYLGQRWPLWAGTQNVIVGRAGNTSISRSAMPGYLYTGGHAWTDQMYPTDLKFEFSLHANPEAEFPYEPADGFSTVFWCTTNQRPNCPVATCFPHWESAPPQTRDYQRTYEVDVVFWPGDCNEFGLYCWNDCTISTGPCPVGNGLRINALSMIEHELGHAVGFDDNTDCHTIMWQYTSAVNCTIEGLHPVDQAAAQGMYAGLLGDPNEPENDYP